MTSLAELNSGALTLQSILSVNPGGLIKGANKYLCQTFLWGYMKTLESEYFIKVKPHQGYLCGNKIS